MARCKLLARGTSFVLVAATTASFALTSTEHKRLLTSSQQERVLAASAVLTAMYALICFELVDRCLAALVGAALALAAYDTLVADASLELAFSWLDLETLSLLLGMMIVAQVLGRTGLFERIARFIVRLARGNFWPLLVGLSLGTALLSSLIDNVTAVLLLARTVLDVCKLESLDAKLMLMTIAVFSNIGGACTPIGDPPNLIIINDPDLAQVSPLSFATFVGFGLPGALLATLGALGYLKLRYKTRDSFANRDEPMLAFAGLEQPVRSRDNDSNQSKDGIRTTGALIKTLAVLAVAIALFFLQRAPGARWSLGWVSLFAAVTILLLTADEVSVESVLSELEWSTLVFFSGLFVVMQAITQLGLVAQLARLILALIELFPGGKLREVAALTLVLWSSAIASALIDNVPLTSIMVKVIANLAHEQSQAEPNVQRLNIRSLVFALVFGTCLGGNATLIGASANLVAAGVSGKAGKPISFNEFARFALPVSIVTLIVANLYLVFVFFVLNL